MPRRANPFDIGHINRLAGRVIGHRAGKPADGDQPAQAGFARLEIEQRHGILRAVAYKQPPAGRIKRQRIGLGAEQIPGVLPGANRLDDLVAARVNHAERILAGIRHHHPAAIGRHRNSAGARAGEDFHFRRLRLRPGRGRSQVNHRNRALGSNVPHRIHAHPRAAAGRAGDRLRIRPPPAPIAHIRLRPGQRHPKGRETHLPQAQHPAADGVQLRQPVGKIQHDVKPPAVRRHGDPGGNLPVAFRGRGLRQGKRSHPHHFAVGADGKYLDVAIDVGLVEPAPVGRKYQPGETQLPGLVRMQNLLRNFLRHGGGGLVGRQSRALQDAARSRFDHDQLVRLAGRDQQPAVGAERDGLRPQTGQLHLNALRRQ